MSDDPGVETEQWRNCQPMTDTDLTDFLALRQVCGRPGSWVGKLGDDYVENERPLLPFIADGLAALRDGRHVTLGDADPTSCAVRPVMVTAIGRARYEHLCDMQGVPPYPGSGSKETPGQ